MILLFLCFAPYKNKIVSDETETISRLHAMGVLKKIYPYR